MSSHVAHPGAERVHTLNGTEPILYDDCPRCEEHATDPFVSLDASFTYALWVKMIAVEFNDDGGYRSDAEAKACRQFYRLAVWMEKFGIPFGLVSIKLKEKADA